MVANTRASPGADTIQPVNIPQPVEVKEDADGRPLKLRLAHWQKVASIEDTWRIDDEWWREKPISRLYYEVIIANGRRQTIFKDLLNLLWYRQNYM